MRVTLAVQAGWLPGGMGMMSDESISMGRLRPGPGSLGSGEAPRRPEDALAGLCDDREFALQVSTRLAQQAKGGSLLAVVLVGLDVEAFDGHPPQPADDALLRIGALRLRHSMRNDDVLARDGRGAGFACLLPSVRTESGARSACLRLLADVSGACQTDGRNLWLRAAIGAALFPFDGHTIDVLRAGAERAQGRARRERLGIVFADGPVPAVVDASAGLVARREHGLAGTPGDC